MAGFAARMTDMWSGVCECHDTPQQVVGEIIDGSPDVMSGNLAQARVTDMTIAYCDGQHTGQIITGAPNAFANDLNKARTGDQVVGCNIGTIVTGNTRHEICDAGGSEAPYALVEFQDTVILYTEVDFGNLDDEEGVSDGLNVYRPPSAAGTPPTKSEIIRSKALESPTSKAPVIAEDPTPPPAQDTPPTTCSEVPTPPPNNFQLSPNFILSQLSTNAAVSHYQVTAQHGLTVPNIVCNLQALCENVLEPLATQYGRANMLVTSGFRTGSSTSQHERGQACDVQFPKMSNAQIFAVAQWVKSNINFDQFILEYLGQKPWLHLSFSRSGNRPNTASNKFGTAASSGSYVWGKLLEKA